MHLFFLTGSVSSSQRLETSGCTQRRLSSRGAWEHRMPCLSQCKLVDIVEYMGQYVWNVDAVWCERDEETRRTVPYLYRRNVGPCLASSPVHLARSTTPPFLIRSTKHLASPSFQETPVGYRTLHDGLCRNLSHNSSITFTNGISRSR